MDHQIHEDKKGGATLGLSGDPVFVWCCYGWIPACAGMTKGCGNDIKGAGIT